MAKTIYVYENWRSEVPTKLGMLYVEQGRGSEHYAFEYNETWLTTNRFAYVLDPELVISETVSNAKKLFADSGVTKNRYRYRKLHLYEVHRYDH